MRVVAVDWSGRIRHERRFLWLAEVVDGEPVSLTPASRREAVDRLLAMAEVDDQLAVGLDFGFSLPAWFLRRERFSSVDELWSSSRREQWLADCPPPFWGRPGTKRPTDVELLRRTERVLRPQPKSVFQIGGAGAVGTGSLRGMPALAELRAAGFAVWPFDPPRLPLVVEMWPRLLTSPPAVKSRPEVRATHPAVPPRWRALATASEDAFDAAVAAAGMAARAAELRSLPTLDDPEVALEGWVWGAPFPDDKCAHGADRNNHTERRITSASTG